MWSRRQIQRISVVVALVLIFIFWTPFFLTLHSLDATETVVTEIAEDATTRRAPPHDSRTTNTRKKSLRTSKRPNSSTTTTSTTMTTTMGSNNNNSPSDVKRSEQQEAHETTSSWKQRIVSWTDVAKQTASSSWSSSLVEWWYMFLLAVQFAAQPILVGWFIPESICRSTCVLAQEMVKFIMAACLLYMSGNWSSAAGWSVVTWWIVAGIPAGLFVIQSYCNLMAYQNLAPINFNVLNQTKTLMAALCLYLVMGKVQSKFQMVALCLLFMSALVMEHIIPIRFCVGHMQNNNNKDDAASANQDDEDNDEKANEEERKNHIFKGVLPILLASFISGLAGALTQKNLQLGQRNPYLYSMELSAASTLILLTSLFVPILGAKSPDRKLIDQQGLRHGWTYTTWIPVLTNAGGGIVVGLVTKHAGSVRKGFALIFGLLLSGLLQARLSKNPQDRHITPEQVVGGLLAALSLWMHAKFPHIQTDNDEYARQEP